MPLTIHDYPVTVQWTGGRDGHGTVSAKHSNMELPIAVPPEFQGTGEGTNPEELLTAAISGCYALTFGIIAANRKLPVNDLRVEAIGQVEQDGPSFTYTGITVKPTIVLDPAATDEQVKLAEDMAHKADSYCIITNAVRGKVNITVEPTITRG